jgi:hypothetical protein
MRIKSLVFLFGALTISGRCLAAADIPVAPVVGSSDYRFLKMEKELSGFGGMFFDDHETLNVYVVHPETSASPLDTTLRASPLVTRKEAAAAIKVLPGQYAFSTLAHWRDRLLPALGFKGVVFLDIDETRNRLVIGVSDPTAIPVVKKYVIASNIPQPAVIFEKTLPFHTLAIGSTVNDQFRPVWGGVQIADEQMPVDDKYGGTCTLGFNATLDGKSGFVTNSHCSRSQGQPDLTTFSQPLVSIVNTESNIIGHESKDPQFFTTPPCASVEGCRYSDSAFFSYDSGIPFDLGTIARTQQISRSHDIDRPYPMYTIKDEDCGVAGGLVQKVGMISGWTTGKIFATCVAFTQVDTKKHLLPCQYAAASLDGTEIAAPGDSGSPVFIDKSNGTVALAGVLWGGQGSPSTIFSYSCIGSVKADLGQQLITYAPPAGKPLITNVTFPPSIPGDGESKYGTVAFTDTDAGINSASFNVLQASCRDDNPDCFQSFAFNPGVTDLKNGQFTFDMWCEGDFYWTTEITLSDVQGNVSNPWMFSVKCDPVSAQLEPITRAFAVGSGGGGSR